MHYVDGNPLNNSMDNLEIKSIKEHRRYHSLKYTRDKIFTCSYCGCKVLKTPKQQSDMHRERKRKGGNIFCSRSCSGRYGKEQQMSNCLLNPS